MRYSPSHLEELRRTQPQLYASLSNAEIVRVLLKLDEVATEALASELRARGWIVRLEQ